MTPAAPCPPPSKVLSNTGPGFEKFTLYPVPSSLKPSRDVYTFGQGPAVIVLHEITGATPELFRFAYRLGAAGFSTFVPILFGQANHPGSGVYAAEQLLHVCLSSQFNVLAMHESSPIADWVRALGKVIHERTQGPGIGVVGLCLTGNFALTMMLDEWMLAPVVSEPALPLLPTPAGKASLHLSDDEIKSIQKRVAEGAEILAYRFSGDSISPPERYQNLAKTFAPGVFGDGALCPTRARAHAVFTDDFDERPESSTAKALENVLQFLKRKLHAADGLSR